MTIPTTPAPGYAGHSGAHTPGPWAVDEYAIPERGGSALYIRSDERHWAICVAHETAGCTAAWRDVSAAEAHANARLIAAAPDMYAALRRIDDRLPNFPDADAVEEDEIAEVIVTLADWRIIRAALAKAAQS